MKTKITTLLGIESPVVQGGMAWVAESHLAAAVSNAGGLGIIGAASAPAVWGRAQIQEVKRITDKPFGVNIMLMSPYVKEVAELVAENGKTPKAASSWTQHYLTGLGIGLGVLAAAGGICLFARRKRRG